ncbi:MAG: DUF309 domain-containing protein [Acidobacteria bacterium]|nr:DUF309 domain-containing protein [Acidobacteriota bacterium]
MPHQRWGAFGPLLSLRCGVALLVLTGLPADHQYPLAAAAGLHNACLFHECHEALEPLWDPAEGDLRSGLQGLILLAGGYHHQQFHQRGGAEALWRDALERATGTELPTPWGVLAFGQALDATAQRLRWMEANPETRDLAPLWEFPRPVWELK